MTAKDASEPVAPDGYELLAVSPFNRLTGPFYGRQCEDGRNLFRVFIRNHHLNRGSGVHGGMLLNFCDIALGRAARWAIDGNALSTISLQCDFVSMAPADCWLEATSRVIRKTRALVFVAGELHAQDRLVMTASGVWKILGAR